MMVLISSLLTGIFFGVGLFLMMRRSVFEILLGATILAYGTFTLILTLSGWNAQSDPPLLPKKKEKTEVIQLVENGDGEVDGSEEKKDSAKAFNPVDPLPQALILTAIVISFGVTGFLIVLVSRGVESTGTMEFGELPKQEGEL